MSLSGVDSFVSFHCIFFNYCLLFFDLAEILLNILDKCYNKLRKTNIPLFQILLSCVCKRWKSLLLFHAKDAAILPKQESIWSTINVPFGNLSMRTQIRRWTFLVCKGVKKG